MATIWNSVREFFNAIRAINEKYSQPRIQMSRMVSFSLLLLRIYLLGMLLLLAYKFVTIVVH